MVAVAGLPFLKLGSLLLKQITKPLASRLKIEASKRASFGKFSTAVGQQVHYVNSRITVFASGYKFLGVRPLPEEEAMKSGVDFMAEGFVLILGASIIVYEYDRSERKNADKAEKAALKEANEKAQLEERFSSLETKVTSLQDQLNRIQEQLVVMSSNTKNKK